MFRFAVPNFGQVLAPLGDLFGLGTLGFSRRATPRANRPTGVGQGPRAERRRVVGGVCAARTSVNSLNSAPLCRLAPDLRPESVVHGVCLPGTSNVSEGYPKIATMTYERGKFKAH